MNVDGKCVVVTGGGHGIGRALVERLARAGANVVVADVDVTRAEKVARRTGGRALPCDVADQASVFELVENAEAHFGPVHVFCSNAGITDLGPDLESSSAQIEYITRVNLLAHVWAAQSVVPGMVQRREGYLLQTISSAALITGPSGLGYTMTKHGALGFAEWLSLNYSHRGIRVSCLCPNAVWTGMLGRNEDAESPESSTPPDLAALGEVVQPELCADLAFDALSAGRFLVLPHDRVLDSFQRKAGDYDRWLAGTNRRLRRMRGEDVSEEETFRG
jgi:NAD(P)-dependent dehydrogenase (short-subunit alcohol dehydrogenase family)